MKKILISLLFLTYLITPIYAKDVVINYNNENVTIHTDKNTVELSQKLFIDMANKIKDSNELNNQNIELKKIKDQYEKLRINTDEQLKLKDERIKIKEETVALMKEKNDLQESIKKDLNEINKRQDIKLKQMEFKIAKSYTAYTVVSTAMAGIAFSATDDNTDRAYIVGAYLLGNYIVKGTIF